MLTIFFSLEQAKMVIDEGSGTFPPTDEGLPLNPQEKRHQLVQRFTKSLVHACQCRDAICTLPSCLKMKRVLTHIKNCKRKTHGGCPICKLLFAVCCYHTMHCKENKCLVPFCPHMKQKLRRMNPAQRWLKNKLLFREFIKIYLQVTTSSCCHEHSNADAC